MGLQQVSDVLDPLYDLMKKYPAIRNFIERIMVLESSHQRLVVWSLQRALLQMGLKYERFRWAVENERFPVARDVCGAISRKIHVLIHPVSNPSTAAKAKRTGVKKKRKKQGAKPWICAMGQTLKPGSHRSQK